MTTQPAHQAHSPRAARRRPTRGRRRTGYAVAALVDVLLLLMVNGWPGWQAVPFLTDDFDRVVGLLNVSFVVHGLAQLTYAAADPPWLRGLGDAITSAIGIAGSAIAVLVGLVAFGRGVMRPAG